MRSLLEFRAGKMVFGGGQLSPDSRNGLVQIIEVTNAMTRDADGLRHLRWTPADQPPEGDVIVLPGQACFRKIGPESQRVYEFKLNDKSCTLFFWMQEADETKDAAIARSFNSIINPADIDESQQQPPDQNSGQATGVPDAAALAQMLSNIFGSSGSAESSRPRRSMPTLQEQAVFAAALLSNAFKQTTVGVPKPSPGPSLADVMEPRILSRFITEPDIRKLFIDRDGRLFHDRTKEEMEGQLVSPQFNQQLRAFSVAIQTGQFDPTALGLRVEGYSAIDFLLAIQKLVDKEKSKKSSE